MPKLRRSGRLTGSCPARRPRHRFRGSLRNGGGSGRSRSRCRPCNGPRWRQRRCSNHFDFRQRHSICAGAGAGARGLLHRRLLRATGALLRQGRAKWHRSGSKCRHERNARRPPKGAATMQTPPFTHTRFIPRPTTDSVTAGAAKSATFVPNNTGKFWQRRGLSPIVDLCGGWTLAIRAYPAVSRSWTAVRISSGRLRTSSLCLSWELTLTTVL
jgi:hypothetical protein